jgi:release factor glutamine methyltransferase
MPSRTTRSAADCKSARLAEVVLASVGEALSGGRRRLAAAGCDAPRLDAELLLAAALDPIDPADRARLVIDRDRPLDPVTAERFDELLARREAREPVAYILGRRDFRHLSLAVDPRVLIPRPETELLVEVGLTLPWGAAVVDVGTGSGAVALALKDERPDLQVRGTDISSGALAVARGNARRLGLAVDFFAADLLDGQPIDAVLANLPYVAQDAVLAPEITRHEPAAALFAGADGLDVVRRLVAVAGTHELALIALEIGPEQAAEVGRLLRAAGFAAVEIHRDLAGHERVVVGTR